MLQIEKLESADYVALALKGELDERVNLIKEVGVLPHKRLVIDTREVDLINSMGVKHWLLFLNFFEGRAIELKNCSPVVVEQINLIRAFADECEISSIMVPFFCRACGADHAAAYDVAQLKEGGIDHTGTLCPECSAPMVFDDIEEDYLAFLDRS